jgi:hypothetical protein
VVAFQSLKSQQFQELPGEHVRADIRIAHYTVRSGCSAPNL